MSGAQKPTLRRIRTFAQDMELVQGKDTTKITSSDTPVPASVSLPTEKAAPAKDFTPPPIKEPEQAKVSEPAHLAEPAHIPAFHELQKKSTTAVTSTAQSTVAVPQTLNSEPPKKVVVRAKKRNLQERVSASGGTIITDTKRNKLNFFEAFFLSINNWFTTLQKELTKKKTPTYTVTDVEHRKGVIQKATSKSGTIFTADRETLKEEIRRRNQTITVIDHTPEISWSPQTEPGFALLEANTPPPVKSIAPAPKPERVLVEFKKKTLPEPVITQPTRLEETYFEIAPPEAEVTPVPAQKTQSTEEVIRGYEAFVAEASHHEPLPQPQQPLVTTAPVAVTPPPPVEVVRPVVAVPDQIPTTPSFAVRFRERLSQLSSVVRLNTNTLTFSIATGVLAIILIVVISKSLVGLIMSPSTAEQPLLQTTALYTPLPIVDLTLSEPSQSNLIERLVETTEISGTPTEIRLVDASTNNPLAAKDVVQIIGFATSKSFIQTVVDAHIVTLNTQRGVLIKVNDPAVAFGSLLAWEPYMEASLRLFLANTQTSSESQFKDITLQERDVRVLASDGVELITYGFIDSNTLLITKDTTTFSTILGSK